jgi:hypothetical protein
MIYVIKTPAEIAELSLMTNFPPNHNTIIITTDEFFQKILCVIESNGIYKRTIHMDNTSQFTEAEIKLSRFFIGICQMLMKKQLILDELNEENI